MLFNKEELVAASELIYQSMAPTPQIQWPWLQKSIGVEVWVKHENHTPIGAFKVRGGITFMDWLRKTEPETKGIVSATRGNHGQSLARAAKAHGLVCRIVVPHGNSFEKNRAMHSFGADLVEYGNDFDTAKVEASRISNSEGWYFVPPYHKELVRGVATYALELFTSNPNLHTVYVPIGCGSGVCGVISVRDALELKTNIVGVVSENAQTAKLSFGAGKPVETNSAHTFADGIAVRVPVKEAFDIYSRGVERIVSVADEDMVEAIRILFRSTHNVAEGAGAASLAALIQERETMKGKSVGVVLSGGNIDMDKFRGVLSGKVPFF
ncbi:MAG: threonine dehydratase [Rhodobacteraceae bacterium]|nr:threonine dehydratase [Paracoccaceae bacterium]